MKRIALELAYVLHRRTYREASVLLECWTKQHGRLTVIAKGVRQANSLTSGLTQPFIPLLLSCAGRGELLSLSQLDLAGPILSLHGDYLFAGLYVNELVTHLLQKWDPHPHLFDAYELALARLSKQEPLEGLLRSFEKTLIAELGYGVLPTKQHVEEGALSTSRYYRFHMDEGFLPATELECQTEAGRLQYHVFSAKNLIAMVYDDWQDKEALKDAKRLMRIVLAPLLGSRPIYSRRLFLQREDEVSHEV